jgi:hypothetical protein
MYTTLADARVASMKALLAKQAAQGRRIHPDAAKALLSSASR